MDGGANREPLLSGAAKVHLVYLAAIIVLLIVVVAMAAKMTRASDFVNRVKTRYGLDDDAPAAAPRSKPLRSLRSEKLLESRTYDQYRLEFDKLVERSFALGDFDDRKNLALNSDSKSGDHTLQEACKLALKGGKRLRPIILMEIARLVSKSRFDLDGTPPVDPANVALAIECFHAASLIVDDLPAFDGDETRRGNPSLWCATSQGTALMASVAIMSRAFQNVCHQVDWIRENCPPDCRSIINADRLGTMLCGHLSNALGVVGTSSGQFMDVLSKEQLVKFVGGSSDSSGADSSDADSTNDSAVKSGVQTLVQRKTSPFFESAFVCGWIVGGGDPSDHIVSDIRSAGQDFGVAFQVADDLGDLDGDRAKNKWNYADVYGVEAAERELVRRLNSCKQTLVRYGIHSPLWTEIYSKVFKMALP